MFVCTIRRTGAMLRSLAVALAMLLLASCALPRADVARPFSEANDHPETTTLGRTFGAQLAAAPGESGFHLLVSGQEAFLARAALAESAERTLDLQYYFVAEDATATLLLYRAFRAAQRGVRVRLLLDDLYATGRDLDLATLASHPNVQVRVFNAFVTRSSFGLAQLLDLIVDGARLNRRMHNKLWIADNAAAVFGGRNLSDEYFAASREGGMSDLDALAVGPIVAEMSHSFDEYWNSEWAVPIAAFVREPPDRAQVDRFIEQMRARAERFRESEYTQEVRSTEFASSVRGARFPLVMARASAVYDSPAKLRDGALEGEANIIKALRGIFEAAQEEVIVISPWFIPSEHAMGSLCGLVAKGVSVKVLTNSLASAEGSPPHAGYARYRPRLAACGVQLHERRPDAARSEMPRRTLSAGATLHAKAVAVDRKVVLVGSMNHDPRSRLSNTEVAILIESGALGAEIGTLFDEATSLDHAFRVELNEPGNANAALGWMARENNMTVRYTSEPLASWWRRFIAAVIGALIPEALL